MYRRLKRITRGCFFGFQGALNLVETNKPEFNVFRPSLEPGSFNLCVGGKKSLVHTVCACSKSRWNSAAIANYRSRLYYVTRIITSSQREASRASYECFTTSVYLRFGYQTLL